MENNTQKNAVIKPRLLKHSQEYRVLATLRYFFPPLFKNMVLGEKPDLQDKANSVGIEVTIATKQEDLQTSRLFSELSLTNPIKDPNKIKEHITSLGYAVSDFCGCNRTSKSGGITSSEERIFKDSIRRKVEKVQDYRSLFPEIGLAILLTEIPANEVEDSLICWLKQVVNEIGHSFDFFFVISERFCIYYDPEKEVSKKYYITDENDKRIRSIAKRTAEGEITIDSPEWNMESFL